LHRRTFLAAGAATLATPAFATGADWSEDIRILRRAYEALHPGLYRYATPTQTARRLDALERTFATGPSLPEAYLALSRFLGTVRCGHTYANFYNQSDAVSAALFDGATRLPFHFRLLGDRMIVTKNQSDDARLARGAEILSIDGKTLREIVRALMPYARADGGNDAKRRALLEVRGNDGYETFDVFHPLVFPVRNGRLAIRARPAGAARAERFEVAAIDLATRRAAMAHSADKNAPAWTLRAPEPGLALLTTPNWALYNSTWDWRAFLDEAFAQIADNRALIVDVRGNEGGLDCGNDIIARLIDHDLSLASFERRVRFRETPADLNPYLDTWDRSFRTLGKDATDIGGGFYRLPDAEGVGATTPKGPRFRGKVFVLTDAQNSSATFQFAQTVQASGLGKLVGGATGGNRRGINGGAFFFLRLPQSGLEADLPLIGRFPADPQPDAGLLPDVGVADTAEDIAAGRDRVLETALALASR
jgi:hypothetical protein